MKTKKVTSLLSCKFFQATLLTALFSCVLLTASAQTVTWTGPSTGGDWSNSANWSLGAVPVATDSVLIASGNAVTISTAVSNINKLSVQGNLNITSAGSLTVSQNVKSTSLLEIGNGSVTNAGSLTLTQGVANGYPGLYFVNNGVSGDGTLTNTGSLVINTAFTGATGECVRFNQTLGGTATLNMGTNVTLTPASTKTVFTLYAGNAQIGGTLTMGAPGNFPNFRLLAITYGNLTLLPSALINSYATVTTSHVSVGAASGKTSSLTNNGTLNIHQASTGNTSSCLNISPLAGSISSTLTNTGTITIDGANSTGSVGSIAFQGGDAITTAILTNSGTITDTHTGTTAPLYAFSSTSVRLNVINNTGTISLPAIGSTLGQGSIFNNNSGGTVNVKATLTGAAGTTLAVINNNLGGIFNCDVAAATNNIASSLTFKNYGTVIGRGIFLTGTFVPQLGGTISPGNATNAIDKFTINGTPMDFSGTTFVMDVNGNTSGGTNYDQVVSSTASAAITMSASTQFNVTVGGSYTPVTSDFVSLFSGAATAIITGIPSSGSSNWATTINTGSIRATYSIATALEINKLSTSKVYSEGGNVVVVLNSGETAQLEIFDATGSLVKKALVAGELSSINMGGFKGICIARVVSSQRSFTQKLSLK